MWSGSFNCCVILLLVLLEPRSVDSWKTCDKETASRLQAGELGVKGVFPWLGLLRVHLYESDKTAVSGVVLVKDRYAIGNAEDIAKIPRWIFKEDTDVLFIPRSGETWICRLLDYLTHPEYDSRISTIALLELDLDSKGQVPFKGVCWPHRSIQTVYTELYTVGYSDALNNIEYGKMIYKLRYENKTTCDSFYAKIGQPSFGFYLDYFHCAVAINPAKDCIWETGMAMVSNFTGIWTLIGLAVQGPACHYPDRFLDFFQYKEWVEAAIDPDGRGTQYRRSGYGIGFKKTMKKAVEMQDISIHDTFLSDFESGRRSNDKVIQSNSTVLEDLGLTLWNYPIRDIDSHFNFKVDRIDKDAINISIFDYMYEIDEGACTRFNYLIYSDRTRIVAKGRKGKAAYRLTVYDMLLNNLTCVQVSAESVSRSPVTLWWMTYLDKMEGTAFKDYPETPRDLLKIVQQKPRYAPTTPSYKWIPGPHLEPRPVEDLSGILEIDNVNLLVTLVFEEEAVLKVKVYGHPKAPVTTTTTTTESTPTTTTKKVNVESNGIFGGQTTPDLEEFDHNREGMVINDISHINLPRRRIDKDYNQINKHSDQVYVRGYLKQQRQNKDYKENLPKKEQRHRYSSRMLETSARPDNNNKRHRNIWDNHKDYSPKYQQIPKRYTDGFFYRQRPAENFNLNHQYKKKGKYHSNNDQSQMKKEEDNVPGNPLHLWLH